MAVIELKGLQGLKGLSDKERDAWYQLYPKNKQRTQEQADRVYRNQQFISKLGREAFDSLPNPADRDKLYETTLVNEAMLETYGDDTKDFDGITSTTAKRFLLENGYQTEKQREKLANNQAEARIENLSANAFVPFTAVGAVAASDRQNAKIQEKDNKHLLEQAQQIDKQELADRDDVRFYQNEAKNNMLQMIQESGGQEISEAFDKLLSQRNPQTNTPLFPYYEAYKDSYQIQNLDVYDQVDILSKFEAIRQAAANASTEEEANEIFYKNIEILNDDIQHRIYKGTTFWDKVGKTGKMVGTKFYSNLGLTYLNAYALYLSATGNEDEFNKFILGKDKDGNDLPKGLNMQYFSGVDQYNVFTEEGVKRAKENGGISEDALLRDVGQEYAWFTGESLAESVGMMGYIASSIGIDLLLTGGVGALAKTTGKGALRMLLKAGVNPRTLVTMRRVFDNPATDLLSDMARLNIHSLGESGMEAASVAQEVYYDVLREQGSDEAQAAIKARVERDVQAQLEREFPNGSDRFISLPDNQGKISAKMLRADELRAEYTRRYTEDIAEEAAGAAYAAQATAMQLKNTVMDAAFKTYMFAKPFKTKVRASDYLDPKKTIFKDGAFEAKNYTWKDFAKDAGKTIAGGGLEEFTDNMVHTGAHELGLNYNNNYLQHLYNGDAMATSGLMTGAAMAYLTGAESAMYDDGTYLEAFIGAMSPVTNVMVNPGAFKYLSAENREALKQLSTLGKINEFLYSPLVRNAMETERGYVQNQKVVEQVNKVIREHGDDFKTLTSSINAITAFNEIRDAGTVVDAKDSKFTVAFNFLANLRTLAAAGSQSKLLNDYQEMLNNAAEGKISDEMVAEYLAQPENKNTVTEQGQERAAAEARQQIQKNAQSMLQMLDEYNSTYSTISDFSKGTLDEESIQQLTFQTMISKNWQSRMQEMENVLTGSSAISSTRKLGQMHDKGREEVVNELTERAHSLDMFSGGKRLKGRLAKIQKAYTKLANTFRQADNSLLTAEEIIRLAPEDRRRMLENHGLYTAEQVEEIEKAENILAQRDPDYRAKVRDVAILQQRIEQNNESYRMLLDNPGQLQQYKINLATQALIDAVANTRRAAIDNMLKDFDASEADNNAVIEKAKHLNSEALKTIITARPQYKEMLSPYVDRAVTIENLNNTVNVLEVSDNQKSVLKNSLAALTEETSTAQEVIEAIENFIESTGDGKEESLVLREQMNEILNAARDFNIVRDAARAYSNQTKLEKDRKVREAKDRKNAKAREKRAAKAEAERQARIAAEEARKAKEAEEERLRQEEEARRKGETMKGGKMEDTTKKGSVTVSDEEAVDLGIDYDNNTSEVQTPTEEPTEAPLEPETPLEPNDELPVTGSNSEATQLRGNVLTPYYVGEDKTEGLETGRMVSREESVTGWLKDFFAWMKNAGIKFQEIIDFELGEIAKLNPTVHYMMAVNANNATNDAVLSNTPLLVVEATDAVKKIHKDSRGGIIKANGKEWLVIGMMGYAPNSNEQNLWQRTLNRLQANRSTYFAENPTERFEVDSKLTTSIKEISNGRLIKQLPKDSEYQYRSISELLADVERNPYGLTWKDLSFAIQMATGGFEMSRTLDGTAYTPSRTEENAGNVFVMVRATNGNYFPVAIRPTFLSEIKPGALQDTIDALLQDVLNSDHKVRFAAIQNLKFLLNLNDEDNILIGTDKVNVVSIKQNGVVVDKFDLNADNFDRAEAFKRLKTSRFRIQISKNNLQDIERLKQLDEAGALTTDAAMLATAGAGYTIYATDLETGKPVDYEPTSSSDNTTVKGSGLYRSQEPTQMLDSRRVTFHNGKWVDDSGKVITDAETLTKIKALNYIEEHTLPVAYKAKNGYNVYIVSESKDKPLVVMVNGSHNVTIYRGADAQRAIDFHNQQQKAKAAKDANMEDIDLGLTEKPKEVVASAPTTPHVVSEKVTTSKEKTKEKETFSEVNEKKSVKDLQDSKNLLTFVNIITNKSFGKQVRDELKQIFKDKGWGEMPKSIPDIEAFLNGKGVPMPSEMSQEQINKWLDLIKNCIK